jgi:signal transduction histidine kinase
LKLERAYHWSEWEVDLVKEIAVQLAIAIQQGQFYQQLNELNANLEVQVQERTVELQQKVEELEHLNILKDDFLSTVSHELRSPLTNMKMSIQMLKIPGLAERQQRYLDVLQTECDREINLINDLLDLQQLQAESYPTSLTDAINLQESLPKIVEPFHYRAVERQQSLKLEISPDIPPLISHLTGLERILAELLNNACKYTPAGGEVIFRVSHQQHTPVTTFTISNPAEIPASELPRIFEKFYRVPTLIAGNKAVQA